MGRRDNSYRLNVDDVVVLEYWSSALRSWKMLYIRNSLGLVIILHVNDLSFAVQILLVAT